MGQQPRTAVVVEPLRLLAEVQAGYQPAAPPQLALVAFELLFRDLDRGLVILGVNPLAGRDLIHPIEAIKPVVCH